MVVEVPQCFPLFFWAASEWSSGCCHNGGNRTWQEPAALRIEGFLPDQNDVTQEDRVNPHCFFSFFPFLLFNPGNEPICLSMQKSRVNKVYHSDQRSAKYGPRGPDSTREIIKTEEFKDMTPGLVSDGTCMELILNSTPLSLRIKYSIQSHPSPRLTVEWCTRGTGADMPTEALEMKFA